jgi:hypothetical protein
MAKIFDTQNRLLLSKKESTFGTPVTLTTTDANVRVRNVELSSLTVEMDTDSAKIYDGTLTKTRQVAGVARGTITGEFPIAPAEFYYTSAGALTGSKYPESIYFESAGLLMTSANPSTSATNNGYFSFAPNNSAMCNTISTGIMDLTSCGTTDTAVMYQLGGAMANAFSITCESAGKPYTAKFSLNGKVVDVFDIEGSNIPEFLETNTTHTVADVFLDTDVTITMIKEDGTAIVPKTVSTYTNVGAALVCYDINHSVITIKDYGNEIPIYNIGGTPIKAYNLAGNEITPRDGVISSTFCSNMFSLDTAPTLTEIMCQADTYGLLGYKLSDRNERIQITPMLDSVRGFDFWGIINSNQPVKFELKGRKIEVVAPYCQIISAEGSDDNGVRRNALTLAPLKNIAGSTKAERQATYTVKIYGKNIIA